VHAAQVLGEVGALPDVYTELEVNFFLLRRLLGVRTSVRAGARGREGRSNWKLSWPSRPGWRSAHCIRCLRAGNWGLDGRAEFSGCCLDMDLALSRLPLALVQRKPCTQVN
jgi:hypothetical protein